MLIFQASVRFSDRSRRAWTLFALAFRLAQALGLNVPEESSSRKPFETEMRRRLWHAIGVLDLNATVDRGTEPMLVGTVMGVRPPANINDTDMHPDMESPITSREGFTDISFCLMCHESEPLVRTLVYVRDGETPIEQINTENSWKSKLASRCPVPFKVLGLVYVKSFENHTHRLCFESFLFITVTSLIAVLKQLFGTKVSFIPYDI